MEVYVFNYPEGWMILYYKDGKNKHYYTCDEHDYDESLQLAEELECEVITYQFESYKEFCDLKINIFSITKKEKDVLKPYLKN